MKNIYKTLRIIALTAVIVLFVIGCTLETDVTFVSKTNDTTANNEATLGLIGISAVSSNTNVATVEIISDKIKITSVAAGSAEITISSGAKNATISITVSASGGITIGTIEKYIMDTALAAFEEYLAALSDTSTDNPKTVELAVVFTTDESVSEGAIGWGEINEIILAAQKYIILELSDCTASENTITGAYNEPSGNDMNIIQNNEYIKSMILPSTLEAVGIFAFRNCSNLESITIPDTVTSIADAAFYGCSGLTDSLTIPGSVTSIGISAFEDCSGLTGSLTIPDSVTSIGMSAFYGCSGLTGSLTISHNVTSIDKGTFSGCSGLTGSLTIPDTVTSIADAAFYGCSGFTGSLTIPDTVTSIGISAFEGCSGLTSITIPDSVTSIKRSAFESCSGLTSVTLGDGLNISSAYFPDDLAAKYTAEGAGTYTRPNTSSNDWTKQ